MNEDEARALVDSIRTGLGDLAQRIERAYTGRAWLALGYADWSVLCAAEFGGVPRLPAGERRPVVRELTEAGMSTRAIGDALGVHHDTVAADRSSVGIPTDGARVLSLDGRSRPMTPPPRAVAPPPPPKFGPMLSALNNAVCAVLDHRSDELATAPLYLIQGLRASCADLARRLDDVERAHKETL